jgi:flagellar hook-length control protein FliK
VMTVHVTPDTLGPVTVRAHVGTEGVRVELFAPTDTGRDALRSILSDLRRDLSGSGLSGTLDLSSENQPSPQSDEQPGWNAPTPEREERATAPRASGSPDTGQTQNPRPDGAAHSIDLIV